MLGAARHIGVSGRQDAFILTDEITLWHAINF